MLNIRRSALNKFPILVTYVHTATFLLRVAENVLPKGVIMGVVTLNVMTIVNMTRCQAYCTPYRKSQSPAYQCREGRTRIEDKDTSEIRTPL